MATALVRQVAVGASFTVAITVDGKVYQMGTTGATGRAKWEGAKSPELVRTLKTTQAASSVLCSRRHFVNVCVIARCPAIATIVIGVLCAPRTYQSCARPALASHVDLAYWLAHWQ